MVVLFGLVLLAAAVPLETSITLPTGQGVRLANEATLPNAGITLPTVVKFSRASYTDEARRREIEGVVTVQAEFDINGGFKILRVVKGLGYGLDESALAALKNWRFNPAYRNGARVSVIALIDVMFTVFDDPTWVRQHLREPERTEREYRIQTLRSVVEIS
jgi:TonB family protein